MATNDGPYRLVTVSREGLSNHRTIKKWSVAYGAYLELQKLPNIIYIAIVEIGDDPEHNGVRVQYVKERK